MLADEMVSIAIDLIDQFGSDIILTEVGVGDYDPTVHHTVDTKTDIACKAVLDKVSSNELIPDVVLFSDTKMVMYAEIDNVDTTWEINGNKILKIDKVGLQNTLVVYEAYVRMS